TKTISDTTRGKSDHGPKVENLLIEVGVSHKFRRARPFLNGRSAPPVLASSTLLQFTGLMRSERGEKEQ
ncbi:hypothetical protein PanWU01x14_093660, partial [Parasponia andersonii]